MNNAEIILASNSQIRLQLLMSAGLNIRQVISNIDENLYKLKEENHTKLSLILANEKAKAVSDLEKDFNGYIIGADQILTLKNKRFSKAKNLVEAKIHLEELKGKTHDLITSVSILKKGKTVFEFSQISQLTMHDFNEEFLESYLKKTKGQVLNSVGCYHIEGLGVQLFSKIEGDYFSILGLPLLQVLTFLRQDV